MSSPPASAASATTPIASACRSAIVNSSRALEATSAARASAQPSDAGARRASSHTASSARRSTAPTSGVSRPRTTTIPSSSPPRPRRTVGLLRRPSACRWRGVAARPLRRRARAPSAGGGRPSSGTALRWSYGPGTRRTGRRPGPRAIVRAGCGAKDIAGPARFVPRGPAGPEGPGVMTPRRDSGRKESATVRALRRSMARREVASGSIRPSAAGLRAVHRWATVCGSSSSRTASCSARTAASYSANS